MATDQPPTRRTQNVVRSIIHVDMDAFFASVEQRDNPSLRGKPVLVGRVHRGVVAAASYEARRFGIHSAMAMAHALKRCPDAQVVTPRFAAYQAASDAVFAIFHRYTSQVEGLSIDEAFLDVTASLRLFGSAEAIAKGIQSAIAEELNLPASAGVAPCKFVAKLASEHRKPRGLFVVTAEQMTEWLAPLSIDKLLGVGVKHQAILRAASLRTFADVRQMPVDKLRALLGSNAERLSALAWGRDERPVIADAPAKSMGAECTLDTDRHRPEQLQPYLLQQALQVSARLQAAHQHALGVQLKLKASDFRLEQRQMQLGRGSADPDELYRAACTLLARAALPKVGVRLVGLAAINLQPGPPAKELFVEESARRRQAIEATRSAIDARFGKGRLTRAAALKPNLPR